MKYKLWLDDQIDTVRPIPAGDEWIGARSSYDAALIVEQKGMPSFISFDYDLGDADTVESFIRYISDIYYDLDVPDYEIHSENVAGQKIIESLMESWKKSKSLP